MFLFLSCCFFSFTRAPFETQIVSFKKPQHILKYILLLVIFSWIYSRIDFDVVVCVLLLRPLAAISGNEECTDLFIVKSGHFIYI